MLDTLGVAIIILSAYASLWRMFNIGVGYDSESALWAIEGFKSEGLLKAIKLNIKAGQEWCSYIDTPICELRLRSGSTRKPRECISSQRYPGTYCVKDHAWSRERMQQTCSQLEELDMATDRLQSEILKIMFALPAQFSGQHNDSCHSLSGLAVLWKRQQGSLLVFRHKTLLLQRQLEEHSLNLTVPIPLCAKFEPSSSDACLVSYATSNAMGDDLPAPLVLEVSFKALCQSGTALSACGTLLLIPLVFLLLIHHLWCRNSDKSLGYEPCIQYPPLQSSCGGVYRYHNTDSQDTRQLQYLYHESHLSDNGRTSHPEPVASKKHRTLQMQIEDLVCSESEIQAWFWYWVLRENAEETAPLDLRQSYDSSTGHHYESNCSFSEVPSVNKTTVVLDSMLNVVASTLEERHLHPLETACQSFFDWCKDAAVQKRLDFLLLRISNCMPKTTYNCFKKTPSGSQYRQIENGRRRLYCSQWTDSDSLYLMSSCSTTSAAVPLVRPPTASNVSTRVMEAHHKPSCSSGSPLKVLSRRGKKRRMRLMWCARGDKVQVKPSRSKNHAAAAAAKKPVTGKRSSSGGAAASKPVSDLHEKVVKQRFLYNLTAEMIGNADDDTTGYLNEFLDGLASYTKFKEIASHTQKKDKATSAAELCNVLDNVCEDASKHRMSAMACEKELVEAVAILALTVHLIKAKESTDMGPLLKSVERQCAVESAEVLRVFYQMGHGHFRVALSKHERSPSSSDDVHVHCKRARLHMVHIMKSGDVERSTWYSCRIVLGQCETLLQHYRDAMIVFDKILEDLQNETSPDVVHFTCETRLGVGEINLRIGEATKAVKMFQAALSESQQLQEGKDQCNIAMKAHSKMASCYQALKKTDLAVEHYDESLKYAERIQHEVGICASASALGRIYESLGHMQNARRCYKKQYDSAKRTGEMYLIAVAAGSLGNAIVMQGNMKEIPKAKEILEEALKCAEFVHNPVETGRAQSNLGNVYYVEQNYAEALKLFRSSCQLSIQHLDRLGQQRSCTNIGNVYMSLEQPALARDWYELARNISPHVSDSTAEANTCYNVGCCYLALHLNEVDTPAAQGHLMQAEENFHNTVALFERMFAQLGTGAFSEVLKLSLFQGYVKAFRQLQFIYCTRGQHEVALEMVERSHGMTFSDLLMHKLGNQLDSGSSLTAPTPLSSGEISSRVQQQTSYVLIYAVCHDQLQIWVVDPHDGKISFRSYLINPAEELMSSSAGTDRLLQNMIQESKESSVVSLSDVENRYMNEHDVIIGLGRLFEVLIGPVHSLLPPPFSGEELVIVPCSALAGASFGALFDTRMKSYLSQMFSIRIVPTSRLLGLPPPLRIKRVFQPDGTATELVDMDEFSVLAIGNPAIPKLKLSNGNEWTPMSLPFARREAVNVARHFGCQPLLGKDAHKAAILESIENVRLVHFATHGLSGENALVLAPPPGFSEDSPEEELLKACTLRPVDLEPLSLKADLVVLSTCATGNTPASSNGMLGLGRAFLLAGAQCVLVSLWDIPDEATERLMYCFYHLVRQSGWSCSSALQHAMHQVRAFKDFIVPKYWAGFQLIGRNVCLDFQRLQSTDLYWHDLIPRPMCPVLPSLHLDAFDDAIHWLHGASSHSWMVLSGPAGSGKTQLACDIAKYYKCVFAERQVVWLDFCNSASLRLSAKHSLKHWCRHTPSSVTLSGQEVSSLSRLLHAISETVFGSLLVLDGVDDLSLTQCMPSLDKCLKACMLNGSSPHVLVTSRTQLLGGDVPEYEGCRLGLLGAQECATAILQLTVESNPATISTDTDNFSLTNLCSEKLSGAYPLMVDQLAFSAQLFPGCSYTSLKQTFTDLAAASSSSGSHGGLDIFREAIAEGSRALPMEKYCGMDPTELQLVNCLSYHDDGSDSGIQANLDNKGPLSFFLSVPREAADMDDNPTRDFLRCVIWSTCPVLLPLAFVAKQVSEAVYQDPNKLAALSKYSAVLRGRDEESTMLEGNAVSGGAVSNQFPEAAVDLAVAEQVSPVVYRDPSQRSMLPEDGVSCGEEGTVLEGSAMSDGGAISSRLPEAAVDLVVAEQVSPVVYQDPSQRSMLPEDGVSCGEEDTILEESAMSDGGAVSSQLPEAAADLDVATLSGTVRNNTVVDADDGIALDDDNLDGGSVTYDGLHGWLSLLEAVAECRVDSDDVEADTLQSNLDWQNGRLSYTYSVRHALASNRLPLNEEERRLAVTACAMTSFLRRYNDEHDVSEDAVCLVIDAAFHICHRILRQRLTCLQETVRKIELLLAAICDTLLEFDDSEGRFAEYIQLATEMPDYFAEIRQYQAHVNGQVLVDDSTVDLILRARHSLREVVGMIDLERSELCISKDRHLVIVSSHLAELKVSRDLRLAGDDSTLSGNLPAIAATEASVSTVAKGFEPYSSVSNDRLGFRFREFCRLLYGLLLLHSHNTHVHSGMWSIEENGLVKKGSNLYIIVYDSTVLDQDSLLEKARRVGEVNTIKRDIEHLGKLVQRNLLEPYSRRGKLVKSQEDSQIRRFLSRCKKCTGNVSDLWSMVHTFSGEAYQPSTETAV